MVQDGGIGWIRTSETGRPPDEIRAILEQFVDDLNDRVSGQRREEDLRGDDTPPEAELGRKPNPGHVDASDAH